MTDLDKMARELLADQYDCDLPGSRIAKTLQGEFEGQLRVADIIALAAIRAALTTAPPGYVLADRATLLEMRNVAMRWARWGSLPECDAFSRIAQDADAMITAAPEPEA